MTIIEKPREMQHYRAVIAQWTAEITGQVENLFVYFKALPEMLRAPCGEVWKLVAKKKISKTQRGFLDLGYLENN